MTVQDLYVQIELGATSINALFAERSNPTAVFEFRLARKQVRLGDSEFEQYWMPIYSLYGQRNQAAVNQQPIVDYFWALCGRSGTESEAAVQESYLLAKILPFARSNGSRRVFVDSFQTVAASCSRRMRTWIADLEKLLAGSSSQGCDEVAFQRLTGDLIGPPEYDDDVRDRYEHFRAELFEEARAVIDKGGVAATELVLQNWRGLTNSIGRRRGNSDEKRILTFCRMSAGPHCIAAIQPCGKTYCNCSTGGTHCPMSRMRFTDFGTSISFKTSVILMRISICFTVIFLGSIRPVAQRC